MVRVATPVEVEPSNGDEPLDGQVLSVAASEVLAERSLSDVCESLAPPPAPGPQCEGFEGTKSICTMFINGLELAAAEVAVGCLSSRSKTASMCHHEVSEDCLVAAVRAMQPESRKHQACASAVQGCRAGLGLQQSCAAAMSAVKEDFQGDMITCIAESCSIRGCVLVFVR